MVNVNTLPKLCILVAFGLSATVTSTDVAQEQPKKESFLSRFFDKKKEVDTKYDDISQPTNTDTQENINEEEPPKYSVEWYLLPRPMNRACLRRKLPWELRNAVPKDCNEPISPKIEKRIRSFFSSSPQNQALRQTFSYYCSD